jgi:hypothetical protein
VAGFEMSVIGKSKVFGPSAHGEVRTLGTPMEQNFFSRLNKSELFFSENKFIHEKNFVPSAGQGTRPLHRLMDRGPHFSNN